MCRKHRRRYQGISIVIAVKTILKELNGYIHPKSVKKLTFEHKPVDHDVIRSINVYFMTYAVIFVVSMLLVSVENYDFTTNFTAVAATFNNIGPGLSLVGRHAILAFLIIFPNMY